MNLTLGGIHINPLQTFTLEVAREGILVGRAFKRNIVVGAFQTSELEYCDPRIPEDDH